jgi:membrane-associated protein
VLAFTLVEKLVEWVQPVFVDAGYFIIAAAVLLERSVFVGLIVPGDVILALGGIYSSQGKLNVVAVIAIGTVAAISGESIGYFLGRRYGARLIRRIPLIGKWAESKLKDSEEFFRKHGGMTVAIGRYATAAGAFVPFSAGVGKMRYARFIAFDAPAVLVWAVGITIFGYVFGRNLDFVDKALSRFGLIALGILAGFFLGRFFFKRYRERRSR